MTLNRVEVDCREIFKAGQLGVAISRVKTSAGLRVLNFHPRYVIAPERTVKEFMIEPSNEMLPDLSCCQKSSSDELPSEGSQENIECMPDVQETEYREPLDTHENESYDLEDLEDDFNQILSSIGTSEEESMSFEIPENYNVDVMINGLKVKKEVTEIHKTINSIITRIDRQKLTIFIKLLFFKLGKLVSKLNSGSTVSSGVREKDIVQFYTLVHQFSTSDEYRMHCLILFDNEDCVSDCHMTICYDILESIRIFYIKEKVDLLKILGGSIPKRHETNASKARVRYVAGYCLATLKKRYTTMKRSNLYSKTSEGQGSYEYAKCALKFIVALKEDEHYLKTNTSDLDSLADIERRQYSSRGLINVSDTFFHFMLKLTSHILELLIYENLMKYGKELMSHCLNRVLENKELYEYEEFVQGTVSSLGKDQVQEFDGENIASLLEDMSLSASIICDLYSEIVKKYIMVLLAQFRKDFKSFLNVEKTMAHRKQIKVSKSEKTSVKTKTIKSQKEPKKKSRNLKLSLNMTKRWNQARQLTLNPNKVHQQT